MQQTPGSRQYIDWRESALLKWLAHDGWDRKMNLINLQLYATCARQIPTVILTHL